MQEQNWEIVTNHLCSLGEGPVWDDRLREIMWVDILEGEIHRFSPERNIHCMLKTHQMVSAVAVREAGGLIAALQHGFAFVNLDNKRSEIISDPEKNLPDNRFNDGKCDPAGRFWVGTMSMKKALKQGNLYVLDTDLSVSLKLSEVGCSNGLAWSSDQKTMYYTDTSTRQVVAFDYNISDAWLSNRRVVIDIDPSQGLPDGMTIDTEGMLWIAIWGGGCVKRYNPHTGALLHTTYLPVSQVTSCAFGGQNLQDLYVTTARAGLNKSQLSNEPLAGSLFVIKACGATGLPAFKFKG